MITFSPSDRSSDRPIPILLDTDIGTNVDDLLAVLFTLGNESLDLVGVTTAYGDTRLRAEVAASTLELTGKLDVPVGYGVGEPLSGTEIFWTGHEGEGYTTSSLNQPVQAASSVYEDALETYGADLVIVAIGPLTNVVSVLEQSARKPRCVYAMAGNFSGHEPDRNVSSDTVAADRMMSLGVPVVFIGIELCRRVPYDPSDLQRIIDARPNHPLTRLVADRTQAWWQYRKENRSNPCDPLTLLALTDPELFEFKQAKITFKAEEPHAGKTLWESSTEHSSWFATNVDVARARAFISKNIIAAIRSAPKPGEQ